MLSTLVTHTSKLRGPLGDPWSWEGDQMPLALGVLGEQAGASSHGVTGGLAPWGGAVWLWQALNSSPCGLDLFAVIP